MCCTAFFAVAPTATAVAHSPQEMINPINDSVRCYSCLLRNSYPLPVPSMEVT